MRNLDLSFPDDHLACVDRQCESPIDSDNHAELPSRNPYSSVLPYPVSILFILLFVAIAFAGATMLTNSTFDPPARCAWSGINLKYWSADVVFSVCVLSSGFISRLIKLFDYPSNKVHLWLRRKPGDWMQRQIASCLEKGRPASGPFGKTCWRLLATLLIAIYLLIKSIYECLGSVLVELLWIHFSLFYGTAKVFPGESLRKHPTL